MSNKREIDFKASHGLVVAFITLLFILKICGVYLFTTGFLLTRSVLDHKSACDIPPIALSGPHEAGSSSAGCWHPKTFNKAVVIVIDALRYDFTVLFQESDGHSAPRHFHNSFPILHESAISSPEHAVLLPFIADPPTATLQRLKGLTTGTLPTFVDLGSNFAGTAIEEDNLIAHLRDANKTVVQLGDDTWHSLFPDLFDPHLTKPYDSFNVWDLHTVDNGVTKHLLPLLQPSNTSKWDFLIGHYLGVDHAGHRYGPDHPAMKSKLQQMDLVIRDVMQRIDEETLLVVMGDHGMDAKGDHGGESSDEVEAALWMYSKTAKFGRSSVESRTPPPNAKVRPVNQIDIVPTLALLLGLPIPFNNLGLPIEEAFLGSSVLDYKNLALVNRLTASQIHRYQQKYALVRDPDPLTIIEPERLWEAATRTWDRLADTKDPTSELYRIAADAYSAYQRRNLRTCKDLWARFDLISMVQGIFILIFALGLALTVAHGVQGDITVLAPVLFVRGLIALLVGATTGAGLGFVFPTLGFMRTTIFLGGTLSCITITYQLWNLRRLLGSMIPTTAWSRACIICILLVSFGFGSNSYTIWEDETLLFFLASLTLLAIPAVFRLPSAAERRRGCYHATVVMVTARLASLSRLCREEQMPYCRSTFYASSTSSTSAPWQILLPWIVAVILPSSIKAYYQQTRSYHGSVPFWVGFAMQGCLFLVAMYWTIDAADNGDWSPRTDKDWLLSIRMYLAQFVCAIAVGAGSATFLYQSPCIGVETVEGERPGGMKEQQTNGSAVPKARADEPEPAPMGSELIVHGTLNLYGSHFTVLPLTVIAILLLLVAKPMGQAALALTILTILSFLELVYLLQKVSRSNSDSSAVNVTESSDADHFITSLRHTQGPSTSGTADAITTVFAPSILALLAHFAFFKTGHQAALSSIQWDAAFIPLRTIRYPWSPILIALNTFAGQILCAAAVPAVVLWRRHYNFAGGTRGSGSGSDGTTTLGPHQRAGDLGKSRDRETEAARREDARAAARGKLLTLVTRALLTHFSAYGALNLATTVFAAHLRRHLMLYRVFSPRWMLGVAGMSVAELVGVWIGLAGVGRSVGSVAGVFGW